MNTEPYRLAELPKHRGSCSNYKTAKAPQRLIFPLAPKQEEEGGSLCFITIGQITADPLVYVFLTSLITAKGRKNPCKAAGSWDRIMKLSMYRGSCCLDWNKTSRCDFSFTFYMLSSNYKCKHVAFSGWFLCLFGPISKGHFGLMFFLTEPKRAVVIFVLCISPCCLRSHINLWNKLRNSLTFELFWHVHIRKNIHELMNPCNLLVGLI